MKKVITVFLIVVFVASMYIGVAEAYLGGCVMSLPFNEGTGTTAYDETGNGNNGALGIEQELVFKFVVGTDGHYGEAGTDYEADHEQFVEWCNGIDDLDLVVITGDISNSGTESELSGAKSYFDDLTVPYYVTKGNHDGNETAFLSVFGYSSLNFTFDMSDYHFAIINSSQDATLLDADELAWLSTDLTANSGKLSFVFGHISQIDTGETYDIDNDDFETMVADHSNVIGTFWGHNHALTNVNAANGSYSCYGGRFGGSWGTDKGYRVVEIYDDDSVTTYYSSEIFDVTDISGTVYNPMWTSGRFDDALYFRDNKYVEVSASSSLNPSGAFTITMWVNRIDDSTDSYGILIGKGVSYATRHFQINWGNVGTISFRMRDTTNGADRSTYVGGYTATNVWHFIVAVYDGTNLTLYVDTTDVSTPTALVGNPATGEYRVRIGRLEYDAGNNYHFNGIIDEVQVYNRALSESEIQTAYAGEQDLMLISGTETLYMRSDLYTVNNETGYGLDYSNTDTTATVTQTSVTDTIYFGFRIYLLNQAGYTRELTSGTPVATMNRASNGSGIQTNTYSMSEITLTAGAETLMIQVYMKIGASGEWAVKATFISNQLLATSIEASTWTFSLYTSLAVTTASFSFGRATAESKITGLSLEEPDLWGYAMFYFHTGDYIMFFLHPYVSLIGLSPFVSIIIFGIGLTVYVRFRNFYFLLLVLVMLSIGGVLQFIMGDALMGFIALLCTFALGALYWKVFR